MVDNDIAAISQHFIYNNFSRIECLEDPKSAKKRLFKDHYERLSLDMPPEC
jgi:hypothetical protein